MKAYLPIATLAALLLWGCERPPSTEAEKKEMEKAAAERIHRKQEQTWNAEDRKMITDNNRWFSQNSGMVQLTITNLAVGIAASENPSTPASTVKFSGSLANKTDSRIQLIVLKISIFNPRVNNQLVKSERIAVVVDVFPTASIPLDNNFDVLGSELAKCIQQIGQWTYSLEVITVVPAGGWPSWLFTEVADFVATPTTP